LTNNLIVKNNKNKGVKMKEDIKVIKQYIKTFNDRKLREEYRLYTSLERPTILENYFKDFIKQEIDTRGIGV
jgi:hypothetical protein